jgi:predicted MPP superfamily phosphohydrolase
MPSRIVAVGDVHGNFDGLVVLLKDRGLIDESNNWIGGDAHLVFSGDLLHRGDDSYAVIKLIMKLEKQTKEKGGNVTALLGNHDLMVLAGNLKGNEIILEAQGNELDKSKRNGTVYFSSEYEREGYSKYAKETGLGLRLSKGGRRGSEGAAGGESEGGGSDVRWASV